MNYANSTRTEIATRSQTKLAPSRPISNDRNPIWVYLARLAPGSLKTMASAFNSIAQMGSDGADNLVTFRWTKLRHQHTAAIRSTLAARYQPATASKMLAALRGVLKECQKLGLMRAEDFQKAVDIPIIKAATLLRARALTFKRDHRAPDRLLQRSRRRGHSECSHHRNIIWNRVGRSEVKQPENLGFPQRFSKRLEELAEKGYSSTHLVVHSALYAMICIILGRQHLDYRRRELVIPGVRLTRAQLNKQLDLLQEAAKAAEALWAALGTENNMVLLKRVTS